MASLKADSIWLHLANVFTKLHGGKLVLESEFGVGTTVALHFSAALFNTH